MFNAARVFLLGSVICVLTGCGGEEAADTANSDESGWDSDNGKQAAADNKPAGAQGDEDFGDEDFGDEDFGNQPVPAPPQVKSASPGKPADVSFSAANSENKGQVSFLGITIPAGIIPNLPGMPGAGSVQSPGQLPESLAFWTDAHIEYAVRIRSKRLPEAINSRAESSKPKPQFAALLKKLLGVATEPPLVVPAAAQPAVAIAAAKPAAAPVRRGRFGARGGDDDDDRKSRRPRQAPVAQPGVKAPEILPGGTVYYDGDEMSLEEYERLTGSASARSNTGSQAPAPVQDVLSDREVVQAIVRGLLINDSAEAWETLQSVLQSHQKTPLDLKQASIVVFEEVFGDESINRAMAEELVVSVLNTADQTGPAMDLLVSLASRVARVDLRLDDSGVDTQSNNSPGGANAGGPTTHRPPPRAVNFSEGDEDFGDEDFERPTKGSGRRGGGRRQAATPAAAPAPAPAPPKLTPLHLPPAAIQTIVPVFRSGTLIAALLDQLTHVTDLTSGKSIVALASMLPNQQLRHATFQVLNEHNEDGADMMRHSGFYGHIARDPGHLLVLKSLPRLRNPQSSRTGTLPPDPSRVSWSNATWEMVRSLRDHLRESSSIADIAWDGQLQPRPYKGTVPEVATELVINEGSDSADETTSATRVYYTRSSVTPTTEREMKAIADHYQTAARGFRREKLDEGILWFDGIRTTSNGLRATMDVIISKSASHGHNPRAFGGAGNGAGAKPGDTFTVETIAVIAADPREAGTSDGPADTE